MLIILIFHSYIGRCKELKPTHSFVQRPENSLRMRRQARDISPVLQHKAANGTKTWASEPQYSAHANANFRLTIFILSVDKIIHCLLQLEGKKSMSFLYINYISYWRCGHWYCGFESHGCVSTFVCDVLFCVYTENGGSKNLWNFGHLLLDYTAQYPRRLTSRGSILSKVPYFENALNR
jgi:hypothetical protein